MQSYMRLLISLLVGAFGGIVAYRAHVPAGGMVGSMLAVAVVNVFIYPMPLMSSNLRLGAQIVIGAALGLQVTKDAVNSLKTMVLPAIMMTLSLIIAGIIIGYFLHKFTGWDLATSLTSAAPGGMTEMSLVCEAMGGDTPKAALMQLVRMVSVVSIIPMVLRYLIDHVK